MSRWFRMYNEALDDPKVQSLNGNDFKGWVNVLLLACRHDGVLPPLDAIAFALRINTAAAAKLMKTLVAQGLIDVSETPESYGTPHGWNGRQYKSDVSTERVKRFRNGARNVSPTVTETPPETETETDVPLAKANGAKADSDKAFWDTAKAYLGPSKASLIGKWASKHGKEETAKAITAAQLARAVNPIPYIERTLRKATAEPTFDGPC